MFCFFFFKQKTAYEMRISDWSSDVCSSDLMEEALPPMTIMFPMPAYFLGILLMFYAFIGWWSAREANRAMPAPDTRTRPAAEAIAAAAITLGIEYPSTKDEIRRARHSLMPRAL